MRSAQKRMGQFIRIQKKKKVKSGWFYKRPGCSRWRQGHAGGKAGGSWCASVVRRSITKLQREKRALGGGNHTKQTKQSAEEVGSLEEWQWQLAAAVPAKRDGHGGVDQYDGVLHDQGRLAKWVGRE